MIAKPAPKAKPKNYPGGLHRSPDRLRPLVARIQELESQQLRAKTYTLVILRPDGGVDVYGHASNQVKIINQPVASTIQNEREVERLIESVLPVPYRKIYFAGQHLRAMGNHRIVTLADIIRVTENLEAIGSTRYASPKRAQLAVMEG